MTTKEKLINECWATVNENCLLSSTSPQDDAYEEQLSEKELDKKLLNFTNKFFNYPAEKRKRVLSFVEEVAAVLDFEYKDQAIQFFRDLCEEANRRDVERYGT